jgi:acetolactate synthase-1/2/3 large subunit
MAAGYARSSGRVGVFLVTSGPGATNSVTPIRDCQADSVPVVLITGQVPRAAIGSDAFQEAPIFNIMSSCAKHVFLLTDQTKVEETMRSAFEIARTGRPGPVVVDIPKDVQLAEGGFKGAGLLHFRGYDERQRALDNVEIDDALGRAFYELLGKSERPLIYAGGGVLNGNAAAELTAFAERFRIPVVTTLMGIGAIDTRSALSMRMLGMHGTAFANYAVEDCDLLIAIGRASTTAWPARLPSSRPTRASRTSTLTRPRSARSRAWTGRSCATSSAGSRSCWRRARASARTSAAGSSTARSSVRTTRWRTTARPTSCSPSTFCSS